MLPTDKQARKNIPLARGLLDYFPDALCAVAELSRIGNDQHNPGEPLHWAREKSTDEADALMRHLIDRGKVDTDGVRHATKVAWRALALLQREIEAEAQYAVLDGRSKGQQVHGSADVSLSSIMSAQRVAEIYGERGLVSTATITCGVCGYTAPIDRLQHVCEASARVEMHVPSREDREVAYCRRLLYVDTAGEHRCANILGHGGQCA